MKPHVPVRSFGILTLLLSTVLSVSAAHELHYSFVNDELTGSDSYSGTGYAELTLENAGSESFYLTVLRPAEGRSADDYRNALAQLMAAFQEGGDVAAAHAAVGEAAAAVGGTVAAPGGSAMVGLLLEPGEYFVSGSCDSCPPAAHLASFTVNDGVRTEPPAADLVVELRDFHFQGIPAEIPAGARLWDVSNTGGHGHIYMFIKLAEGRTMDDFTAWFSTLEAISEPLPADIGEELPAGAYLDPGSRYFEKIDLAAGNYVVVCPIPEASSGQTHMMLGMIQGLVVR
jgi:hypothetical protein